jgi:hypothetical protein
VRYATANAPYPDRSRSDKDKIATTVDAFPPVDALVRYATANAPYPYFLRKLSGRLLTVA